MLSFVQLFACYHNLIFFKFKYKKDNKIRRNLQKQQ